MPTGYTASIVSDDGVDFNGFVLNCARAFGALISLKEEDHNIEIPDEIKPNVSFYEEKLKEAEARLKKLSKMKISAAKVIAQKEFEKGLLWTIKSLREKIADREKYDAILQQVLLWVPPTKDHENLKSFMIDQINSSIKWDCSLGLSDTVEPKALTGKEWMKFERDTCKRDIEFYTEQLNSEVNGSLEKTMWIQQLKQSLKSDVA